MAKAKGYLEQAVALNAADANSKKILDAIKCCCKIKYNAIIKKEDFGPLFFIYTKSESYKSVRQRSGIISATLGTTIDRCLFKC